jgi:arsenate reductase (thioredoxin)
MNDQSVKPLVLILCTGNSCRSQMAEAFLRRYAGGKFEVASAGSAPKKRIHPLTIRAMEEAGFDLSGRRPKGLKEFLGRASVRHLIIVCDKAAGSCPRVWPGVFTRQSLPFDDPAEFVGSEEETLEEFRRVRDQIDEAMRTWSPQESAP